MNRTPVFVLALLLGCPAGAQPVGASVRKVAVLSLIGDEMTIEVYRQRTGTLVDRNHQQVIPLSAPVFDHAALLAVERALAESLPADAIVPLAVPAVGSDSDPGHLLTDGRASPSNPLVDALRKAAFTHLLTVTKHRGPARLRLVDGSIGSGYLRGLGFYIDNSLRTKIVETNETGQGLISAYVYIRLSLVDLTSLETRAEQTIVASRSRSAASNKSGFDAWGAMTAEEKVDALQSLLRQHIAEAVPELLRSQ